MSAITFVLEEIIEDLNNRDFLAQVLIASVTATFVSHTFLGDDPAFVIPSIGHFSGILYLLPGCEQTGLKIIKFIQSILVTIYVHLRQLKGVLDEGEIMPNVPQMGRFFSAVGSAIQIATDGQESASKALQDAAAEMRSK